jgi:predicted nucleic acid-binding protein
VTRGLLDTNVLISTEGGRALDVAALPDEAYVCVVTVAELRAGVLSATDVAVRARRLATLEAIAALEPLTIDAAAAAAWAAMVVQLRQAGRRVDVNDLWVAAVAAANQMPVVTQDADFDAFAALGLVDVVKV